MRLRSLAVVAGILTILSVAPEVDAQGSWLPYGTLGASDITVTPSGVVWLISREPRSIRSTLVLGETRFTTPNGSPARVAADLNGFPWLVNADGSLWHYVITQPGKEEWVETSLKAIDVAVGPKGEVWAIDNDHHVMRWKNENWESIGGYALRIAVDPSGNPWIVNAGGEVSQWTGTEWKDYSGTANDIAIAPDGNVFILGTMPVRGGFEILRLNGSQWQHVVGGGGVAISAGTKAVYVAQDTTTGLVLSSVNDRIRVSEVTVASANPTTAAPVTSPANAATPADATAAAPKQTNEVAASAATSSDGSAKPNDSDKDKGGVPGAGAVGGAAGLLGGLLSKAVPAAAGVAVAAAGAANPVPSPQAVAAAAGAAAGGAAAGAALDAAGNLAPGGGAGNAASTGNQAQPENSKPSTEQPAKPAEPENPLVRAAPPVQRVPFPGQLSCPIIGSGAAMEKLCDIGREALRLAMAPPADCAAPSFAEDRNGGECWTCPASFQRNTGAPVDSANACLDPTTSKVAIATLVSGCATYKAPAGYGIPFRDSQSGNECYVCPLPFKWSVATLAHLSKGDLSACVGKGKDLLVWKLAQYPETGSFRFMPGLLSMAMSDPKAVDAFLNARAKGDSVLKHQLWTKMIREPSSSAELKALMFASLLNVANQDSATAEAKQTLTEFETYMRSRRFYVAQEALRMFRKARQVDSLYVRLANDSGGVRGAIGDAAVTAITDFKTYAWTGAIPDSAGTAFVLATEALAQLGAPGGVDSLASEQVGALSARYLQPVTSALAESIDMLQEKRSEVAETAATAANAVSQVKSLNVQDAALIGSTLMGGAMKVSRGVLGLIGKGQVASDYEKYVEQMSAPLKVKDMLQSKVADERQTLMLYWALATSPHNLEDIADADIKAGSVMTGSQLCISDAWTIAQCTAAKATITAAAKAAGYVR